MSSSLPIILKCFLCYIPDAPHSNLECPAFPTQRDRARALPLFLGLSSLPLTNRLALAFCHRDNLVMRRAQVEC